MPPESSGLKPLLSPFLISMALSLSRVVDVITDPLVGHLSDRTKTRWGRRIPFIALGTLPLSLTTIAFFFPPNSGEITKFIYLLAVGFLFFTFYTIVGGPYNALIPEIGETKEEQLSLSTWQSIFRLIYSAVAMILPPILIKSIGGDNQILGIRGMVILLATASLLGSCFTIFGVKEDRFASLKESNLKFKEAAKIALKDKNFIFYLAGLLMFFTGFNSIRTIVNYYVEDIMGYGKLEITIASALLFAISALFFYPVGVWCKRYGYKKVMLYSLYLLIFLTVGLCFLGRGLDVKYGFLIFALLGIPIAGAAFILPPAMLSDISRKMSVKNSKNIEGIYFGIQGFFLKGSFFISILVLPGMLTYGNNGFVGKSGIYMTTIFSIICFLIGVYFYSKYED